MSCVGKVTHVTKLGPALNEACRSITGCLRPTSVENVYLFTGIAPPDVKRATEVAQVIPSFKNSSAGWDELPTFVAKKCVDEYIEPLTYLINTYFTVGVFSTELKFA